MKVLFDELGLMRPPELEVCGLDGTVLAPVVGQDDLELDLKFNEISTISFKAYKYIDEDIIPDCYTWFCERRQIHVESIGYFIISECSETSDENGTYCEIVADSCESELNDKKLNILSGTYKFYDELEPTKSIMGKILALIPDWTLGSLPSNVKMKSRTFEDIDEYLYSFMTGDLAESFGCLFSFDIEKRIINVINAEEEMKHTDVLISFDTVMKRLTVKRQSENIKTALSVTGSDELDIRSVNPIGGNVIYNFQFYKNTDWMSNELIEAIDTWESNIKANESSYSELLVTIQVANSELNTLNSELSDLKAELKVLEEIKLKYAIGDQESDEYEQVLKDIENKKAEIDSKVSEIEKKESFISEKNLELADLQRSLSLNENFSGNLYRELNRFIFQGEFRDSNIIVTSTMSYEEKQDQIQLLYENGKKRLEQVSMPEMEIDADCENFLLIPELETYRNQLELGCLIDVEIDPADIGSFMLLGYTINWSEKTLTLTFGNRFNLHDPLSKYQDLYQSVTSSANTIADNKHIWDFPSKSGTVDKINEYINSSLDLTHQSIISSKNQEFFLDSSGATFRSKNPDSGELEPNQMKLTCNGILLSDDYLEHSRMAIGRIVLENGTIAYGINADLILAGHILGGLITTGRIESPANPNVYFDLDTGELAASQLKSSTEGATDVVADIGLVKWSDGGSSKGLDLKSSDGAFARFHQRITSNSKNNLEISSVGDIQIRSNTHKDSNDNIFKMYLDDSYQGHFEFWRAHGKRDDGTNETDTCCLLFSDNQCRITQDFSNDYSNYGRLSFYEEVAEFRREWNDDVYDSVQLREDGISFAKDGYNKLKISVDEINVYLDLDMHNWNILNCGNMPMSNSIYDLETNYDQGNWALIADTRDDGIVGIDTWVSDSRLKTNIKPSEQSALNVIKSIPCRQFDWKKDGTHVELGVIAQDLELINPMFVYKVPQIDENGEVLDYRYQISVSSILPYVIKAIQELGEQSNTMKCDNQDSSSIPYASEDLKFCKHSAVRKMERVE